MMKTKFKKLLSVITAACMTFSMSTTAFAATGTAISKVYLSFDYDISIGDDIDSGISVEIYNTSSPHYYIDYVEVLNDDDVWEAGDIPKYRITLCTDSDDYYFSSSSSSQFSLSNGDKATYSSASRSDSNHTIKVTVKLPEVKATSDDLDVENVEWDDSYNGIAVWDENETAKSYQVRLYRGSSSVTDIFTTSDTSYNFAGYFTKAGTYYFKVRAYYSSSIKGSWEESDEWDVESSDLSSINSNASGTGTPANGTTASGAWFKDTNGWWYCNADRTYTTNNWQQINGLWYYFNGTGYMITGWLKSPYSGKWYYLGSDGSMWTSRTTPDGYYVGSDGVWVQ